VFQNCCFFNFFKLCNLKLHDLKLKVGESLYTAFSIMKYTFIPKRRLCGTAEDFLAAICDNDVCGILFRFQIHT
jgi:hypothetical protein